MLYRKVDCPHCGNEITLKSIEEDQKCKWCRRLVKAKFTKRGKKWDCEGIPVDFKDEPKSDLKIKKKNYDEWIGEDIYGKRRH